MVLEKIVGYFPMIILVIIVYQLKIFLVAHNHFP